MLRKGEGGSGVDSKEILPPFRKSRFDMGDRTVINVR